PDSEAYMFRPTKAPDETASEARRDSEKSSPSLSVCKDRPSLTRAPGAASIGPSEAMAMQSNYDAIIVGGGPAGCAAAAFIARSKWSTLIVDRSQSEGFLGSLGNVSYFPGFPESISGAEILKRMRRQCELEGARLSTEPVTSISAADGGWRVATEAGREYHAKAVVVCTGAASRTNYLQGEREFMGRGVSYDVIADGPAVAKRTAAVIGKTKEAAEAAIALARFAEKIHFIIPSNKLEAGDDTMESIKACRAIETHFSTSLKKINGEEHVKSITVFSSGQEKEIPAVGVFTFVHEHKATTSFLQDLVEMGATGAIKVDRGFATSAEGVFACGDVLCGKPQMPAVAASQGLIAGMSVGAYLNSI
ncbi:MAG: FAD-dependent oxidoreductase, partial [Proteobacteria bacterium]|nr:FAD-dependent oxidoreductase [Pseudomonadota bacterium]